MGAYIGSSLILRPHGRIYLSTDQLNLVNNTDTKVLLDEINVDPLDGQYQDGIEDTVNNRITPGVPGLYICFGQIAFSNCIVDKIYCSKIYRNFGIGGSRRIGMQEQILGIYTDIVIPVFGHCWVDADDYIELIARSCAGVDTVDITLGSINTFLYVQRIR